LDLALLRETASVDAGLALDAVTLNATSSAVERIVSEVGLASVANVAVAISPVRGARVPADALIADGLAVGGIERDRSGELHRPPVARTPHPARPAVVGVRVEALGADRPARTAALTEDAVLAGGASLPALAAVVDVEERRRLTPVGPRVDEGTVAITDERLTPRLVALAGDAPAEDVPLGREGRLGVERTDVAARAAVVVFLVEVVALPIPRAERHSWRTAAHSLGTDVGADVAAGAAVVDVVGRGPRDECLATVIRNSVAVCMFLVASEEAGAGYAAHYARETCEKVVVRRTTNTARSTVVVVGAQIDAARERGVRAAHASVGARVRCARTTGRGLLRRGICRLYRQRWRGPAPALEADDPRFRSAATRHHGSDQEQPENDGGFTLPTLAMHREVVSSPTRK